MRVLAHRARGRVTAVAAALIAALGGGALGGVRPARAADCTVAEQHRIADDLPRLKSWETIHAHFKAYLPRCDDGWMAEGYSDVVAKTLARQWATLRELDRLAGRDPAFRAFVLRHVDATVDHADLRTIAASAGRDCPHDLARLCEALAAAAAKALGEAERRR